MKTIGQLDILNAGHGHLEIKFDGTDALELARAERVIKDMLRRGYALFVHGKDDKLTRVQKFDEMKGTYIIADSAEAVEVGELTGQPIPPRVARGRKARTREVKASEVKTTAIGRSAGG